MKDKNVWVSVIYSFSFYDGADGVRVFCIMARSKLDLELLLYVCFHKNVS